MPGGDSARWADPTWPNRTGYSIPCAIMLGSGRAAGGGKAVAAREHTEHRVVRVALSILLFVLYILLLCIVVVTVRFVCCSVKLFLPFSSHSPPHPSGGKGGRVTLWPFVAGHGQTATFIKEVTDKLLWGFCPS